VKKVHKQKHNKYKKIVEINSNVKVTITNINEMTILLKSDIFKIEERKILQLAALMPIQLCTA
jgi:hypothetical protein